MKNISAVFLLCLILVGCITLPPLTDGEISSVSNPVLCELSRDRPDEYVRLSLEISRRKTDCSPAALYCSERGLKKGTNKYSSCQRDYYDAVALEQRRLSNPDWAYCTDQGFATGTEAMAICMASWQQQRQNEEALELQQQQLINNQENHHREKMMRDSQHINSHMDCTATKHGNMVITKCH